MLAFRRSTRLKGSRIAPPVMRRWRASKRAKYSSPWVSESAWRPGITLARTLSGSGGVAICHERIGTTSCAMRGASVDENSPV
jgi:hypothetical protein